MISIKHKKYILIFLPILILFAFIIYPKRVIVSNCSISPLKYTFRFNNINKLDTLLIKQRFNYSTNIDKKYISLVLLDHNSANVEEYIITKNEVTDINIPHNTSFIISLHANSTITYTWNIKNSLNPDTINFIKKTKISIPIPLLKSKTDGDNYDRENLYFKSLKDGNDKLVLRYEHKNGENNEFFQSTLNINIK